MNHMSTFEPMQVSQILDRTFRIYFSNFTLMISIVAVPVLVNFLFGVGQALFLDPEAFIDFSGTTWILFVVTAIPIALISLLLYSLSNGATTVAVSNIYLGKHTNMPDCYKGTLTRFNTFVLTHILLFLIIFVGTLLCVIPGIVMAIFLAITTPVVVLENHGVENSLRRAWGLLEGYRAEAFLVLLVFVLINFAIGMGVGMVNVAVIMSMGQSTMSTILGTFMNSCVQLLTAPLITIAMALLYYNCRIRKEGYDLELLSQDIHGEYGTYDNDTYGTDDYRQGGSF